MSFKEMDKPQLLEVAEAFGVDVDKRMKEENIIMELLDDGVTYEAWLDLQKEYVGTGEEDAPEEPKRPEPKKETTASKFTSNRSKTRDQLLKMERRNPTFQTHGFTFTKDHPFVLVSPDIALSIMSLEQGFRVATPEEAEEFYKNG